MGRRGRGSRETGCLPAQPAGVAYSTKRGRESRSIHRGEVCAMRGEWWWVVAPGSAASGGKSTPAYSMKPAPPFSGCRESCAKCLTAEERVWNMLGRPQTDRKEVGTVAGGRRRAQEEQERQEGVVTVLVICRPLSVLSVLHFAYSARVLPVEPCANKGVGMLPQQTEGVLQGR